MHPAAEITRGSVIGIAQVSLGGRGEVFRLYSTTEAGEAWGLVTEER